jgi:deferrochelatase/peroxidase EfeB
MSKCPFDFTRRGFMGLLGGAALVAGAGVAHAGFGGVTADLKQPGVSPQSAAQNNLEPFWGKHQSGIITPAQDYTYFAAFDLATTKRDDVITLLQKWTKASAALSRGQTVDPDGETVDSSDVLGLSPSRLTITFGFGPGLFVKDGHDRFGLKSRRPEALVDLPKFSGDQLVDARTGGDISIQACADNPQVAFHAVRQLARMADYTAQIRWTQAGFIANQPDGSTTRNLLGFKDGTGNPHVDQPAVADKFIWVGSEGPDWMRGGSYSVTRRIRIALEHWDKMKVAFQEQTIGRQKLSGAPLGRKNEMDAVDLNLMDKDGNPAIPENAHIRLATAAANDGAEILRRSYSYNDGVSLTAERWPPWRQGMEYDAGLLFMSYQRDPRTGFIKIFDKMSKFDMLNQFTTHVGSGLFACPAGAKEGEFIGQRLFA